jgi:hypothetical protein
MPNEALIGSKTGLRRPDTINAAGSANTFLGAIFTTLCDGNVNAIWYYQEKLGAYAPI